MPLPLSLNKAMLHNLDRYISLSKAELANFCVIIKNGELIWQKSQGAVSTNDMTGKSALFGIPIAVPDLAAYAVDCDGNVYIHEHISPESHPEKRPGEYFTHSSFFAGGNGLCFGMISVRDGKITYLDNESGHYYPTEEHLSHARDILKACFHEKVEIQTVLRLTNASNTSTPTCSRSLFSPPPQLHCRTQSTASTASTTGTFVDYGSQPASPR